MKNLALVFNCHYNGLGLIHGLKDCDNLQIYALDSARNIGTHSKYVKYIKVPSPLNKESAFISFLMNNIQLKENQKAILFPTNDEWIEAVSKHQEELKTKYICCVSNYDTIKKILDKHTFSCELEQLEIPVPTVYSENVDLNKVDYPIAIKSIQRRHSTNDKDGIEKSIAADKLRFVICHSAKEAEENRDYAKKHGIEIYFQKIVQGDSSCMRTIGLFAKDGNIKGLFYGKKVRGYPAQFGDCVVGEVCEIPDWARGYAKKIIQYTKYTGIAEIEFMIDKKSGEPYFIEMNPRSWSWIEVCKFAGLNLAKIAYDNLVLGIDTKYQEAKIENSPLRFYKVLEDYKNCTSNYAKDGFNSWAMSKKEWKDEKRWYKCIYAEFPKNDISITIYNLFAIGKRKMKEFVKRIVRNRRGGGTTV